MDKNRTKMGLRLWCSLAIVTMVSFADEISGQHGSSSQPCNPNPCGPNTSCTVTEKGYPLCWCLKGYSKNSEGLCTPQCKRNQDCASDQYCSGSECREACELRSCPSGAICRASNHVSQCVCPEGSYGNPLSEKGCSPNHPIRLVNLRTESSSRVTATASSSISCQVSSDCPTNLMCLGLICVDPCKNLCGVNAVCKVLNHIGTCECLPGFVGDPFLRCQVSSSHSGGCPPNTCGIKAICEMRVGKVYCKCPQGHYGNPLHRCTPECEIDDDCSNKQFCKDFRCQSACDHDTCVQGALCNAAGHRPVCTCPPGYLGSPQSRCYPECSEHSHCPGNKACLMSKCKDPCENSCGLNAKCETENHVPICSCPKGMTGHPFDRCRPFTSEDICIPNPCGANANCKAVKNHEGNLQALCTCPPGYYGKPLVECKRGNCVDSHDCPSNMVCQRSQCMNPCNEEKCGIDALCRVNSHRVYCLCPDRYTGNAFERCYPPRN